MAVSNSEEIQLSHKRSFEVLFSKSHGNICSDIAAVVWEKIPLISISNGPIIIHSTINDASTSDKQTGGLLEAKTTNRNSPGKNSERDISVTNPKDSQL